MLTKEQLCEVEKWIDIDPVQVALKSGDAEVAQAVAALQKAKSKLPEYFDARCELTTVMVEQATSQAVAKTRTIAKGKLAVDLTCGAGVDTFFLSQKFEKVITVEIDDQRAMLARRNFDRLGVQNVEVICESAENFMANFEAQIGLKKGEKIDLIFCDPSRRTVGGKRLYSLQDCAPNIIEIMPTALQVAKNVSVKLSPLFDVDELFKIFPNSNVEVISHNGECKEVVLHCGQITKTNIILHTIIKGDNVQRFEFPQDRLQGKPVDLQECSNEKIVNPMFVHQPDVAFYKARTVDSYMRQMFPSTRFSFENYIFTEQKLENFVGKSWKIERIEPYHPKNLKKVLAQLKITRATIIHRQFPHSTELICKQLAINEGGSQEIIFTKLNNQNIALFVSLL